MIAMFMVVFQFQQVRLNSYDTSFISKIDGSRGKSKVILLQSKNSVCSYIGRIRLKKEL